MRCMEGGGVFPGQVGVPASGVGVHSRPQTLSSGKAASSFRFLLFRFAQSGHDPIMNPSHKHYVIRKPGLHV